MMKYMLKFFVLICLFGVSVAQAEQCQSPHIESKLKIKAPDGSPVEGLRVTTRILIRDQPTQQSVVFTSDHNGYISSCVLRSQCSNGFQYTIEDPINRIYKTKTVRIHSCNAEITMQIRESQDSQQSSRNVYADPAAVAQNGPTQQNDITYYAACDQSGAMAVGHAGGTGNGPKKHCWTLFSGTRVQLNQADILAKLSVTTVAERYTQLSQIAPDWARHFDVPGTDTKLNCNTASFTERNNRFYFQCVSEDKKDAYEFKFKDLKAKLERVQKDTAAGICKIYNLPDLQEEGFLPGCDIGAKKSDCKTINWAASQFSWNASIPPERPTMCFFDFQKTGGDVQLKTYTGLDPHAFENISVYSNEELILLLYQYAMNRVPNFKNFGCKAGARRQDNTYALDVLELFGTDKEIVTCTLITTDNTAHEVQFLFKSVSATNDFRADGGRAGFNCIANDGMFDGQNCVGIGKIQCDALNAKLSGGAKWNPQMQRCELPDAVALDKYDQTIENLKKVGIAVVGLTVTVATGGAGAGMLVVLASSALATVSAGMDIYNVHLENIQNVRARDFIAAAGQCPGANYARNSFDCGLSKCAQNVLLTSFGDVRSLIDPTHNLDSQLSRAVTWASDKLFEDITPTCLTDEFVNKLKNTRGLDDQIFWANIIGVTTGAASGTASMGNGLIDALRNLPRGSVVLFSNSADAMSTIDKLKRLWDTANNAKDTFKFFNAAGQAVDRLSN